MANFKLGFVLIVLIVLIQVSLSSQVCTEEKELIKASRWSFYVALEGVLIRIFVELLVREFWN